MTPLDTVPAAAATATSGLPGAAALAWLATRPAQVFLVLSLLFGLAIAVVTPPLRAPDEAAHFLRAYGIAAGEIIPDEVDDKGRKGLFIPARLNDDFTRFEHARYHRHVPGFSYGAVFAATRAQNAAPAAEDARPAVFVLYTGSEGYSPAAYWPMALGALVGRAAGLDFLPMFYLMRLFELIAMSLIAAAAVAAAPRLKWAFVLIAMLPASLYGRSVLSADGGVVSYTLIATALSLRAAFAARASGAVQRAVWMTLCVLSKPPQIAFVLLELFAAPMRAWPARWRTIALVILPGVILTPLWIWAVGASVGEWRMIEGDNLPPEQFSLVWKAKFLLEHPGHFPAILITSLDFYPQLWRQLIGVLGWLDTPLRDVVYPLLTLPLALVCLQPLELQRSARWRLGIIAALIAVGYFLAVCLIFYLSWSPVTAERIQGLQGRYFIPMLPMLAIVIGACLRRGLSETALAAIALFGSLVSGVAVLEALLRFDWRIGLPG